MSVYARPGDDADLADDIRWADERLGKRTAPEPELIALVKSVARHPEGRHLNPQIVAGVAEAIYSLTKDASGMGNDAPSAVSGAPARRMGTSAEMATLLDAAAKVKAAREAHRHPATGQFRAPGRSAGTVLGGSNDLAKEDGLQTAGPFSWIKPGKHGPYDHGTQGITAH